jgi:monofunctional biosynthetic peptidoglycan transglycosylase
MKTFAKALLRWIALLLAALLALQLFFVARIVLMAWVDPQSSSFERSEAWRILQDKGQLRWRQQWVDYAQISDHLKRAVIASEDDSFAWHEGVDWDAMEKAWQKNAEAEARTARLAAGNARPVKPPKIVGGSTITQQLAKNLLLSGERTLLRKGQELMLAYVLEKTLSKQRILELYLNHVEWGEGVFGAEAAARYHFRGSAATLSGEQGAFLAAILPSPRRYGPGRTTAYVQGRIETIRARMGGAQIP